jgi:hypothetical protein
MVLKRLGISPDEVHHVFVNHKLLSSRNTMALWLGYRQVREGMVGRSLALDAVVQPGDRLALFAHDMALLVI